MRAPHITASSSYYGAPAARARARWLRSAISSYYVSFAPPVEGAWAVGGDSVLGAVAPPGRRRHALRLDHLRAAEMDVGRNIIVADGNIIVADGITKITHLRFDLESHSAQSADLFCCFNLSA